MDACPAPSEPTTGPWCPRWEGVCSLWCHLPRHTSPHSQNHKPQGLASLSLAHTLQRLHSPGHSPSSGTTFPRPWRAGTCPTHFLSSTFSPRVYRQVGNSHALPALSLHVQPSLGTEVLGSCTHWCALRGLTNAAVQTTLCQEVPQTSTCKCHCEPCGKLLCQAPWPWKTLEASSRSCLESVERGSPLPELPCPDALQDGRRVGDSSDGPRTESKEAVRPLGTPPALVSKPQCSRVKAQWPPSGWQAHALCMSREETL